jgi:hypothetical protein
MLKYGKNDPADKSREDDNNLMNKLLENGFA